MKKKFLAALSAALVVSTLSGCAGSDTVHITVAKVKNEQLLSSISYDGTISAADTVSVIPNVMGKVLSVSADIGKTVKAGDILFTLENTDAKLQFEQANANLKAAQSNFSKTANAGTKQSETQMRQALERAENELRDAQNAYDSTKQQFDAGVTVTPAKLAYDTAKADYDRIQWLVSIGEESQFSLDTAKNRTDTALAQYESAKTTAKTAMDSADSRLKNARTALSAAKENLNLTVQTVNPENVKGAQAQIDNAQAAVNIAQKKLDDTVVKSPIDGCIAAKNIKSGDMVSNQTPAMTVINPNNMEMMLHVTESNIGEVSRRFADKLSAEVTIKDSGDVVTGTVSAISPSANPKTGLYDVKIIIDNKNGLIKDGMLATAVFKDDKTSGTLYIPKQSVIASDGKNCVYILSDGKLTKTEVTLGSEKNRYIAVTGLKDSDEVVVDGADKVTENGKFRVISSGN